MHLLKEVTKECLQQTHRPTCSDKWFWCEKKLNETRHGHTRKSETDKSRARRAEYKGQRRRLTHQWRCKMRRET